MIINGGPEKGRFSCGLNLSSESVEGSSLPLEGVDDVECGDGFSLGVFGISDGIPDHVLQKDLENSSGLFVDQTGNAFNPSATGKSTDRRFRDSLDVIPEDLSVALGTSLSQSLSAFSSS